MVVGVFNRTTKRTAYYISNFAKCFQIITEFFAQFMFENGVLRKVIVNIYALFNIPPFDSEDAKVIRIGGYAKKGVASFLNASYFETISSSCDSVFLPVAS